MFFYHARVDRNYDANGCVWVEWMRSVANEFFEPQVRMHAQPSCSHLNSSPFIWVSQTGLQGIQPPPPVSRVFHFPKVEARFLHWSKRPTGKLAPHIVLAEFATNLKVNGNLNLGAK